MDSHHLPAAGPISFKGLKNTNDHSAEYWSARDLQLKEIEQRLKSAGSKLALDGPDAKGLRGISNKDGA